MKAAARTVLRASPLPLLALAAWSSGALDGEDGPRLGAGAHTYEWIEGWGGAADGSDLGSTHGNVAVDSTGRVYVNTDTERAVCVFAADGRPLGSWGAELAGGLHGMVLVREDGEEFLYLTHLGRHELLKTDLPGEILWTLGWPEESGLYAQEDEYLPTSVAVAPDGRIFVADGYGKGYVHRYDAERRYLGSFGGPGVEPGEFQTPHGLWLDTRREPPVLIVADRRNHRLQVFDLEGEHLEIVTGFFRRPSSFSEQGGFLAVADLGGRVTLLDPENRLVFHLGDNPDPGRRGTNQVGREAWKAGEFLAPHGIAWTPGGDLVVADWNVTGRVSFLRRVR